MLSLITLMVMALATMAFNMSLPPVSYTKAIDVWTGTCLTFVFGALLTCVVANYLGGSGSGSGNSGSGVAVNSQDTEAIPVSGGKKNLVQNYKEMDSSMKVDMVARIVYPVLFVLFLIAYYVCYLSSRMDPPFRVKP